MPCVQLPCARREPVQAAYQAASVNKNTTDHLPPLDTLLPPGNRHRGLPPPAHGCREFRVVGLLFRVAVGVIRVLVRIIGAVGYRLDVWGY